MKNFQQNLLITLALGLCGLCVWQWYVQTVQRDRIEKLDQQVYKQSVEIQGATNSIAGMEAEIGGQSARIAALKQTLATNDETILDQKRDILRLQIAAEGLSNEIVQYQSMTNLLATKLAEAYAGIKKQNDAVTKLVAERDEFVNKYNDSVKARNEVVEKYNDLVQQVKKYQDAQGSNGGK